MKDYELTRLENRCERARPVDLRVCLKCDGWMRSTGSDHRICNTCRNSDRSGYAPFRRAGERVEA